MMCKACSEKKSETRGLACCTAAQLSYCHGRCTVIRRFHAQHINVAALGLLVILSQTMGVHDALWLWICMEGSPALGAQTVSTMETMIEREREGLSPALESPAPVLQSTARTSGKQQVLHRESRFSRKLENKNRGLKEWREEAKGIIKTVTHHLPSLLTAMLKTKTSSTQRVVEAEAKPGEH